MGAAPKQDIDIHLPRRDQQGVGVGGRDDGVAVGETDAEGAMGDDFGEGELGGFDVEVAFDDLQVGRDLPEEVVGFFAGEVAEAEGLADLAGGEEFFELWGFLVRGM